MVKKVILDVDTGSDDAVALCTAILSPKVELVAACTVFGNLPIENTTDNTLRLFDALGVDIPVYKGAAEALTKDLTDDYVKWDKGTAKYRPIALDENGKPAVFHSPHLPLAPTDRKEEDIPAAWFYVDYLRKAKEKTTLIAVGPLTNLGLALRLDPTIVEKIDEIVVMGGGDEITNADPGSEANIYHDPEAAQIVVSSGARVVWIALDVTHRAVITQEDCDRFHEIGTFSALFCEGQCRQRIRMHDAGQPLEIPHSAAVHDALAVAYVIDPSVITDLRHVHVDVGLSGYGEGRTIVDKRHFTLPKNSFFAYDGERHKFADILCDCFSRDKSTVEVLQN